MSGNGKRKKISELGIHRRLDIEFIEMTLGFIVAIVFMRLFGILSAGDGLEMFFHLMLGAVVYYGRAKRLFSKD